MTLQSILSATKKFFTTLTKSDLVELIVQLKKDFSRLDTRYKKLEQENAELKAQLQKQKIIEVNKQTNKPSSKKAEWEKPTSKKSDSNQDNPKKTTRTRTRKRKARKGAGNRSKNRSPDQIEQAKVEICDRCGKNLKNKPVLGSTNEHTIEDITEPAEKTEIIKIVKEKKYCSTCKHVQPQSQNVPCLVLILA